MEYIGDENKNLKIIIRENDNRISYLENKLAAINYILNYGLNYGEKEPALNQIRCYMCDNIYLYDEIKCDCNMFCNHTICRLCFLENSVAGLENKILVCQHPRCDRWICHSDGVFLNKCNGCAKNLCPDHYNNTNLDLKNWNCKDCCYKTLNEYKFEEV